MYANLILACLSGLYAAFAAYPHVGVSSARWIGISIVTGIIALQKE